MNVTPVLLIILDGFGYREACDDNAICQARKPHWNFVWKTYPHTTIDASEKWVGLPAAQMGNSEVGHLNIGSGRVVYQDYTRVEAALESGEFFNNPVLKQAVATARSNRSALHILGLVSPGGVHSHVSQIAAMVEMAATGGVSDVCVHAFLDGRDTPPRSAAASIERLQQKCAQLTSARIGSIVGRYYAMDRDHRWERIQVAYDLITQGKAPYQAPRTDPFWETDGRVGYYARVDWQTPWPLSVNLFRYDNRGDRVSGYDNQTAWRTRLSWNGFFGSWKPGNISQKLPDRTGASITFLLRWMRPTSSPLSP